MATFIVTFDLKNATSADYTTAAKTLARLGLGPLTPNLTLELPMNTYSGVGTATAASLRESIKTSFTASRLTPRVALRR
jgi:hypothetical protein